jgi:hypothetical protein
MTTLGGEVYLCGVSSQDAGLFGLVPYTRETGEDMCVKNGGGVICDTKVQCGLDTNCVP